MELSKCPFCLEEIKTGAIKCKHCNSMLTNISVNQHDTYIEVKEKKGTLWFPVTSLVLGIISFLALFDDSAWVSDTYVGLFVFTSTSFLLGLISLNTQELGKGMAIAGIILSLVSFLIGAGFAIAE
jgi:hypothetical protein